MSTNTITVEVKLKHKEAKSPLYSTLHAAGADIYAVEDFTLKGTKGKVVATDETNELLKPFKDNSASASNNFGQLFSALLETLEVKVDIGSAHVETGIILNIPLNQNLEVEIRGRSGLAFKQKIEAFNGTVDADYRNEVNLLLYNYTSEDVHFKKGERIGQMVIKRVEQVEFKVVEDFTEQSVTDSKTINKSVKPVVRGIGGLGSTGK